jgi:cellulose biosynthesis protein BcsQ
MKILSIFNNKGGVGKTTLTYHLGHILAEMGKKVLMIDLDPQCNLSIYSILENEIGDIWEKENNFIKDFKAEKEKIGENAFQELIKEPRSIHFLLAPTEQGESDIDTLPPPYSLTNDDVLGKLDLIVGRLSVNTYEGVISERWSKAMLSDPLALRTIFKIRSVAEDYSEKNNYDFVLIDTSPSLGTLNKVIISTVDGFFIPCLPDLFSLYGIRNIGEALGIWKKEFELMRLLLKNGKKEKYDFPFVKFLGYTIFNAKKYTGVNGLDLAKGNYHYAQKIAESIKNDIDKDIAISDKVDENIGGNSIMHTHNTHPNFAQRLKTPIWKLKDYDFSTYITNFPEEEDEIKKYKQTMPLQKQDLEKIREGYETFANDLLNRIKLL